MLIRRGGATITFGGCLNVARAFNSHLPKEWGSCFAREMSKKFREKSM